MKDARQVIANALFNYKEGEEANARGKRPWGIEKAEWRADAVITALIAAGFDLTPPVPSRDRA